MNSLRGYFVLAMVVLIGAPSLAQARPPRTIVRSNGINTLNRLTTASRFLCGNAPRGGSVSKANGSLPRFGKVQIDVSTSWDWGLESADHDAALIDITPQALGAVAQCVPFSTTATVTITAMKGGFADPSRGQVVADIVGGTISHVVLAPDPRVTAAAHGGTCPLIGFPGIGGTIDETLISFDADPGQPDTPHGSISGTRYQRFSRVNGVLRARFNSCTGEFDINQIIFDAVN